MGYRGPIDGLQVSEWPSNLLLLAGKYLNIPELFTPSILTANV